ncbi:Uncharacterized protein C4C5.03 [Wickerhamiella sorbophila]|uniref:Uncharacterized protein C4C5.03 n=1 Tax=Wickerhamiella sorbophila TaxID=45607 RepID=A0A2T0FFF5_9ASCO|nr:Uncharacterized protein C4C5.03 [Wickerhamiella sorbophila]PRT53715.1 Uncharacterized protein C4C5.03 [Wickerhamiella sorbophila]
MVEYDCSTLRDGSVWNTWLSLFLVVGIYGSYVPQQVNVVKRRTIEGLSLWFLFLMNIGAAFGFANILIASKPVYRCCCTELSAVECGNAMMGVGQMASSFLGPLVVMILGLIYAKSTPEEAHAMRWTAMWTTIATAGLVVVVIVGLATSFGSKLAYLCGLAAAGVGLVQYIPQLMTTYTLKHAGTLSLLTLLIQIPGGMIWSFSLAVRGEVNWSIWMPIMLSAILQVILLCMAFYFSLVQINRDVAQITKTPPPNATNTVEAEALLADDQSTGP